MTRKANAPHLLSTPVLPVHEMAQAIDFYQRLGLSIEVFDAGYAWVMTGGHEQFHLRLVPDLAPELNECRAVVCGVGASGDDDRRAWRPTVGDARILICGSQWQLDPRWPSFIAV